MEIHLAVTQTSCPNSPLYSQGQVSLGRLIRQLLRQVALPPQYTHVAESGVSSERLIGQLVTGTSFPASPECGVSSG